MILCKRICHDKQAATEIGATKCSDLHFSVLVTSIIKVAPVFVCPIESIVGPLELSLEFGFW